MNLSVIVPVRDGVRTLEWCLSALARQTMPPAEVIVVDNGSRDGSGQLARAFTSRVAPLPLRVVDEPRRGATFARNRGAASARGDVFAFTDADCEPAADWAECLSRALEPGIGAVAGSVRPAPPRTAVEAFSALSTLRLGDAAVDSTSFTLIAGGYPTANLAVRRDVFVAAGGFDEQIRMHGEDYDLCARIYRQGHVIRYDPRAIVSHHHRTTLRGLLTQSFNHGSCHAYLLRRHFRRKLLIEAPGVCWQRDDLPGRVWLDLASADKKLATVLVLALWAPAVWGVAFAYLFYLYVDTSRRFHREQLPLPRASRLVAPFLLLAKSAAMTAGRIAGSLRFGAVCF